VDEEQYAQYGVINFICGQLLHPVWGKSLTPGFDLTKHDDDLSLD